jgi:two-component system response regulator MprA
MTDSERRQAMERPGTDVAGLRALVVEDDPDIADAVRRGLILAGLQVEVAGDGRTALVDVAADSPDLVVLDLMLPDVDGVEVCRRIRVAEAASPGGRSVPILMLTARDAVADRVAGLQIGADDYLVKPFALEELIARVEALLRRTRTIVPAAAADEVLRVGDIEVNTHARTVRRGGRVVPLSAREYDVLLLLVRHPNRVLLRSVLMDRFWGDYYGESNVLEVLMAGLRQKLEAGGEPRLVHTVRGVGYVLRHPVASER